MTQRPKTFGLESTEWNWLLVGLVGPLLPAVVTALVVGTKEAMPTYGSLVLIATAAALFTSFLLLPRTSIEKEHRAALKAGLDTAWNFWAFLGVGTLLVSFTGIGAQKLETSIAGLPPRWLAAVFVTVCTVAAARFALSLAEVILLRRSAPTRTPPSPSDTSQTGH